MNERGYLGEFFLWLLGRELPYPNSPHSVEIHGGIIFSPYKTALWQCAPTGDYYAFTLQAPTAPNVIHRAMQRFILGIKYRRINGS
jgi:hypothetical protein